MRLACAAFLTLFLAIECAPAANEGIAAAEARTPYFWKQIPAGDDAQLLVLMCRGCKEAAAFDQNVPLLAVLRDTLGDGVALNDRVTAVWLLSNSPPTLRQRLLSAVPFFYWSAGKGRAKSSAHFNPLLDMNSLQRPMLKSFTADVLQWAALDPYFMPLRATSRAYRTNQTDHERLHLEEAIAFLREAPAGHEGYGLTDQQLQTLLARLELRKRLLGGLVSERGAKLFGESEETRFERIRSRNWELLRQCATKTGLYFEPIELAGASGGYAILWAPRTGIAAETGSRLHPIWKLLNLKKPTNKQLLQMPDSAVYERPAGAQGARTAVVPLGVYSLDYPKAPLLLIDFRHRASVLWRAMTQRSINEVTAGVIGISHFTNWYYYVAADLYDFIASRRGAPMNQAARLDSYAQFQAKLALDRDLDPRLRQSMQERIEVLAINPLETSPEQKLKADLNHYQLLVEQAGNGVLQKRIERDRQRELAIAGLSTTGQLRDEVLHAASFGLWEHHEKQSANLDARVDLLRRAQHQLLFLNSLAQEETPPEVDADAGRIQSSIAELKRILPQLSMPAVQEQARQTIALIQSRSQDRELRAQCELAIASFHKPFAAAQRVALKPSAVHFQTGAPNSK